MPKFWNRNSDSKDEKSLEFETKEIRTLYVETDGWKCRSAKILDEDNSTVLYEIDFRFRRPNLTFRSPESKNETVGTIRFNPWTRAIQADTEHGTIPVKSKNWKCCDLPYTSPAFGGRTLTWQRQTPWVVLDHYLVDEHAMPIARFRPKFAIKRNCVIEIVDRNLPQDAVDEIVMIGMAVMENTKYYACSGASAAASSSVSGAVA